MFDFLSVLGSNFISSVIENFKIFKLFKIIRVRKIGDYISKLTLPKDVKAFINMIKLAFYMILWLHITACIWYYIVNNYYGFKVFEDPTINPFGLEWYPILNWDNPNNSVIFL